MMQEAENGSLYLKKKKKKKKKLPSKRVRSINRNTKNHNISATVSAYTTNKKPEVRNIW